MMFNRLYMSSQESKWLQPECIPYSRITFEGSSEAGLGLRNPQENVTFLLREVGC